MQPPEVRLDPDWMPAIVAGFSALSAVGTILVGKLFEHLGVMSKGNTEYKQTRIDKLETRLEVVEEAKDKLFEENVVFKAAQVSAAQKVMELERKEVEQHNQISALQQREREKEERIQALLEQAARHREEINEAKDKHERVVAELEKQRLEQEDARKEIEKVCVDLAAQLEDERVRVKADLERKDQKIQVLQIEIDELREENDRFVALLITHGIPVPERRINDEPVENDRRKKTD
jgi:chromosome segregation ATPase